MIRISDNPVPRTLLIAALMAWAFFLRWDYARGLPLNPDEAGCLRVIENAQHADGAFRLPLGSRIASHPLMASYIAGLGLHVSQGSIFFTRVLFILLSMAGLAGIYALGARLFGPGPGLAALALGVMDRHLIAWAPLMTEQAGFFAVPWMWLFFLRAVEDGRDRDWAALGGLSGAAFMFYEITLLV